MFSGQDVLLIEIDLEKLKKILQNILKNYKWHSSSMSIAIETNIVAQLVSSPDSGWTTTFQHIMESNLIDNFISNVMNFEYVGAFSHVIQLSARARLSKNSQKLSFNCLYIDR